MKKKIIALVMASVMLVVVTVGATVAWLTAESEEVTNTFVVGNIKILLNEADVNRNDADSEYNEFVYDNSLGMDYEAADRVQENVYELTPGSTYFKDPKVTVLAGSERCYVFVKVTESNNPLVENTNQKIVDWTVNGNFWTLVPGTNNVYYYNSVVDVNDFYAEDEVNFNYDDSNSYNPHVDSDPYLGTKGMYVNGEWVEGVVLPTIIKEAKITIPDEFDGVFKDESNSIIENPKLPELKFDAYAIQADNMEDLSIYDIWTRLDTQLNPPASSAN
ncbi:MAG: hypothetical protein IKK99_02470 [Oscillospiraceae bacterium]|nr:hypothetical protein [Oscillospiraceae bacterium]